MKITARYTSPARTVELGDLLGELPMADVTWNGGQQFQEQQYCRGDFIEVFDRKNERNEFNWTVWRKQESLAAAFQFVLDHTAELRGLARVEFTFTDEGGASVSRFMNDAKVIGKLIGKLGLSNQWGYTVIGGEILATDPNQ